MGWTKASEGILVAVTSGLCNIWHHTGRRKVTGNTLTHGTGSWISRYSIRANTDRAGGTLAEIGEERRGAIGRV